MQPTFIDLGLPSGTLWAAENEPGYHQFDKAVKTFGDMLPPAEAWQELFNHCSHKWDNDRKGYVLTARNGNSIFLPANGWQDWNKETKELNDRVHYVGCHGLYLSSSPDEYGDHPMNVYFCKQYVAPQSHASRFSGFSVRLCKSK